MTTQWRKMESWRPVCYGTRRFFVYQPRASADAMLAGDDGQSVMFQSRATALRAANKQNDLEGLPRVS